MLASDHDRLGSRASKLVIQSPGYRLLYCLRPGPQAQGWTRKCKRSHRQYLAEGGFTLSPSARTGLADLAPRAKVGQTVGCSTFTRGAKPATRRVADGERMNTQGKERAYAPMQKTMSTRAMSAELARPRIACPLRARSAGQRRELTVTFGQPDIPAHV